MPTRFNLVRKTAATWTSDDTVLGLGEVGIETDTRNYKVGNGVTAWDDLPYKQATGKITACGLITMTDSVVVETPKITADSLVFLLANAAGAMEIPASRVAGTSFYLECNGTATIGWMIVEPSFEDNEYVLSDGNQITARTK